MRCARRKGQASKISISGNPQIDNKGVNKGCDVYDGDYDILGDQYGYIASAKPLRLLGSGNVAS